MLLLNVNGQDSVDVDNIFLVVDRDFDATSAKNDNRYISLSRTEKTRSYFITKDNRIYGIAPTMPTIIKRINKAYEDFGRKNPGMIKVSENAWMLGETKIILLTDLLTRVMQREEDRLKRLDRVYALNFRKKFTFNEDTDRFTQKTIKPAIKSYIFVKGEDDDFLIKTALSRNTITGYIRNLYKKGVK